MSSATRGLIETAPGTRFTVDEYFRMSDAGIFGDRRVELIGGRVMEMPAQGSPHRQSTTLVGIVLTRFFGDPAKFWLVYQGTYILSKYDAPEPDFHVFETSVGTPDVELPTPFLVVEVSHSTVNKDRGLKLPLYAEARVPEYWIINLDAQEVEVYRKPTREGDGWHYADVRHAQRGESITMLRRPDVIVAVDEILAKV